MFYGPKKYEGSPSHFHAFTGSHVFEHSYSPAVLFEPQESFGFFNYSSAAGGSYGSAFLGADLGLVFWQRFLVKAGGYTALQGNSSTGSLTALQGGVGLRLWGYAPNTAAGTLLFQLDGMVNYWSLVLNPALTTSHYDSPALLIEPKIVFLSRHQIVPWLEYGIKSPSSYQRLAMGLDYRYTIRSWRMAVGLGGSFDKLMVLSDEPDLRFTIARVMTSLIFYL
jgi:hypothetical protein